MDTTMARFSHEKHFSDILAGKYDIIIGTQMVAKGLDFPNVTLVGVLSADSALYAQDYRSFERAFSLFTQVVGRSGRAEKAGRAYIQTFTPENPVIALAAAQDYDGFLRGGDRQRRIHLYPPFCDMVGCGFSGLEYARTKEAAPAVPRGICPPGEGGLRRAPAAGARPLRKPDRQARGQVPLPHGGQMPIRQTHPRAAVAARRTGISPSRPCAA